MTPFMWVESPRAKSVSWATPEWILDAYRPFFDPCPLHDEADALLDGLAKEWPGFAFVNPPFGRRIGPWVHRCVEHGDCVVLTPARMDTKWFQRLARAASLMWFPLGRLAFGGQKRPAPFPTVLTCIGGTAEMRTLALAAKRPGLLTRVVR